MTDAQWFCELYEKGIDKVSRYLTGALYSKAIYEDQAEISDITHEMFLRLWEKRAALRSHPNIEGWMIKTANNVLKSHLYGAKGRKHHAQKSIDQQAPQCRQNLLDQISLAQYQEDCDQAAMLEQLQEIKALVGEGTYHALLQYYEKEIGTAILAQKAGITPSGIRMRVKRIIRRIKKAGLNKV